MRSTPGRPGVTTSGSGASGSIGSIRTSASDDMSKVLGFKDLRCAAHESFKDAAVDRVLSIPVLLVVQALSYGFAQDSEITLRNAKGPQKRGANGAGYDSQGQALSGAKRVAPG